MVRHSSHHALVQSMDDLSLRADVPGLLYLVCDQFEKVRARDPMTVSSVRRALGVSLRTGQAEDVIAVLVDANKRVASCIDERNGMTALHEAVRCDRSFETIKMLYDQYPEAALQPQLSIYTVLPPKHSKPGDRISVLADKQLLSIKVPLKKWSPGDEIQFEADPQVLRDQNFVPQVTPCNKESKNAFLITMRKDGKQHKKRSFITCKSNLLCRTARPHILQRHLPKQTHRKLLEHSSDKESDMPVAFRRGRYSDTVHLCDGQIPLHSVKDESSARLLIEAYPKGVTYTDVSGSIPLHYAACNSNVPAIVVEILITEGKKWIFNGRTGKHCGALVKNCSNETPFSLLCNYLKEHDSDDEAWKKMKLLACAAYEHLLYQKKGHGLSFRPDIDFNLVQATVSLECSHQIVTQALCISQDKPGECPVSGRFLLSLAAMRKQEADQTTRSIIEKYGSSQAHMKDCCGRLPLHWSLDSNLKNDNDGAVRAILEAAPEGITVKDPETGLYPFMMAASSNNSGLSIVYELMRECPEIVSQSIL